MGATGDPHAPDCPRAVLRRPPFSFLPCPGCPSSSSDRALPPKRLGPPRPPRLCPSLHLHLDLLPLGLLGLGQIHLQDAALERGLDLLGVHPAGQREAPGEGPGPALAAAVVLLLDLLPFLPLAADAEGASSTCTSISSCSRPGRSARSTTPSFLSIMSSAGAAPRPSPSQRGLGQSRKQRPNRSSISRSQRARSRKGPPPFEGGWGAEGDSRGPGRGRAQGRTKGRTTYERSTRM